MKSLNLTILLCLCCLSLLAQQYVHMPTGGAYWRYRSIFAASAYPSRNYVDFLLFQTGEDSTINGIVYKKIMMRSADTPVSYSSTFVPPIAAVANKTDRPFMGLRESNQKVYIYHLSSGFPQQETLLYDFTASVGDTVPDMNYYKTPDSILVVTAIDSVQIGANFRKRYRVARAGTTDSLYIIEGLGSERGLLEFKTPAAPMHSLSYTFYCANDGNITYNPGGTGCPYIWPHGTPSSVPGVRSKNDISIYPVPFSNTVTIDAREALSAMLYNMLGAEIIKQPLCGKIEIQTGHLQPGIYFLKLTDTTGTVIHTQKLVKE